MERQADGSYRLSSALDRTLVLDVVNGADALRTDVHTWPWSGHPAQRWDLVAVGNGLYKLKPRCAPALCLDVENANPNAGGNLWLWEDNGNAAQHWRLLPTSPE